MKVGVIGTGYVGLVTGVCLADFGVNVCCMDTDSQKIENLKNGISPIYEFGMGDLIQRNIYYKRIEFTDQIKEIVEKCEVIFIAVGTPTAENGTINLEYVLQVAKNIGQYINGYKVIITKSTVPVGTGKKIKQIIQEHLEKRMIKHEYDIVSNPEFLREGKAIYDFTHPDRVVIGCESEKAIDIVKKIYKVLDLNEIPFVYTNIETSEMIKYASNAFLAVKISFINEMALLTEKIGVNIQDVAMAIGMDERIGSKFLHAGAGYGGSCFPKDTKGLIDIANNNGEELFVVQAAIDANEKQKQKMVEKIENSIGMLQDKTIGILGLSFKPETDDMRDAPSLDIISNLVKKGVKIRTFCPKGMVEAKWRLKDLEKSITYCKNEYEVSENANGVVLMTEWNQFTQLDINKLKAGMKEDYFFDFRNVYSCNKDIKKIFKYSGVGI